MAKVWKVIIGLALALPMMAYVAGSLASSTGVEPGPRDPVIIQDVDTTSPSPSPRPSPPEPAVPATERPRGAVDDNGIRVVNPQPTRLPERDDDDDGDERDDDSRDDEGDDSRGDDD